MDRPAQVQPEKQSRDSEEKFRLLFAQANVGIALQRLEAPGRPGQFTEVNDYLCRILGFNREELLGLTLADLWVAAEAPDRRLSQTEPLSGGYLSRRGPVRTKDGRLLYLEVDSHTIQLQGEPMVMSVAIDITGRIQAEHVLEYRLELERSVSRVGRVLNSGQKVDMSYIMGTLGRAVAVSRAYAFRFRENEGLMDKTAEWCADGVASKLSETQGLLMQDTPWFNNLLFNNQPVVIPDITALPPEAFREKELYAGLGVKSLLCVPVTAGAGRPSGFLGFADTWGVREWRPEDVELLQTVSEMIGAYLERELDQQRIHYLSFHDKLTDLYNKAFFEEEMGRLDTRRQLPLSIIVGDLNGLKFVNDTFGHQEGDRLLVRAAAILRDACRKEDIVARWGGDEFTILLPRTAEGPAAEVVDRIRRAYRQAGEHRPALSIALGTATKANQDQSIANVFKEAEDRMYRDKLLAGIDSRSSIITSLEKTLWKKSCESEEHARRLQTVALELGRAAGLSDSILNDLALLSMLHDIGKIGVPDEILTKSGPLSAGEWEVVRRHPEIGYRIAGSSPEMAPVAYGILTHHERWDGRGYPQGLQGEAIPLIARIVAIADAFDVMTNPCPYKAAVSPEEALAVLNQGAGSQFDPQLVRIFVQLAAAGNLKQ